ncbi:hypothetical protein TNCV_1752881 [Trichonephila clavipes]|nr:hypothetical protein TNCV_1752881 [Trichonephila clavipes]
MLRSKANACDSFDLIRQNYDRKNIHLRDAVAGNIDGNLNPNDIGSNFHFTFKLHRQSTEHAGIHARCDDLRTSLRPTGFILLHSHVIELGRDTNFTIARTTSHSSS